MKPLEHRIRCATTADGRVKVWINGRPAKVRWMNIHASTDCKSTAVTLEVLHEPIRTVGEGRDRRLKSYVWDLSPCQFIGQLPAELFKPQVFA